MREIKTDADGVTTLTTKYYDLTEELEHIFPRSYHGDTEASYQTRVEMLSDLVEACARKIIEKDYA